jgi:hypothetical protein
MAGRLVTLGLAAAAGVSARNSGWASMPRVGSVWGAALGKFTITGEVLPRATVGEPLGPPPLGKFGAERELIPLEEGIPGEEKLGEEAAPLGSEALASIGRNEVADDIGPAERPPEEAVCPVCGSELVRVGGMTRAMGDSTLTGEALAMPNEGRACSHFA